jgi:hypothetical protein
LAGAAEQQQCFSEVDGSGVDEVEAVDELAGPAVRIIASDLEKSLRDRQRRAQFVGGVGGESLLFGDLRFDLREHGVEGIGEFAELVLAAFQLDPVGERPVRRQASGIGDASQGREHAAGEDPSSQQAEHQQECQHGGCLRGEGILQVGAVGAGHRKAADILGYVPQQERPHDREQQDTRKHEEPRVAEGEFEANTEARGPIHVPLPQARGRAAR